jgi:hypothetical protein
VHLKDAVHHGNQIQPRVRAPRANHFFSRQLAEQPLETLIPLACIGQWDQAKTRPSSRRSYAGTASGKDFAAHINISDCSTSDLFEAYIEMRAGKWLQLATTG